MLDFDTGARNPVGSLPKPNYQIFAENKKETLLAQNQKPTSLESIKTTKATKFFKSEDIQGVPEIYLQTCWLIQDEQKIFVYFI